jgi:hypothetical protein
MFVHAMAVSECIGAITAPSQPLSPITSTTLGNGYSSVITCFTARTPFVAPVCL